MNLTNLKKLKTPFMARRKQFGAGRVEVLSVSGGWVEIRVGISDETGGLTVNDFINLYKVEAGK